MSDSVLIGFIDSLDKFFLQQQIDAGFAFMASVSSQFFELSLAYSYARVDVPMMLTMIPVIETTIKQFLTRAFSIDIVLIFGLRKMEKNEWGKKLC